MKRLHKLFKMEFMIDELSGLFLDPDFAARISNLCASRRECVKGGHIELYGILYLVINQDYFTVAVSRIIQTDDFGSTSKFEKMIGEEL